VFLLLRRGSRHLRRWWNTGGESEAIALSEQIIVLRKCYHNRAKNLTRKTASIFAEMGVVNKHYIRL